VQPDPAEHLRSRESEFGNRRYILQQVQSARTGDRKCPQLAAGDLADDSGHRGRGYLRFTADHGKNGGIGSLVRHMRPLDAGGRAEDLARQMQGRADAARAEIEPAGLAPGQRKKVAYILHRQPGVDHDDVRHGDELADGGQVPQRIERDFRVQAGCCGQAGIADEEGVAVGRGLGHRIHADHAAGARLVLHHDGHAEDVADRLRDVARNHVGGAARRIGDDPADRPRRIGLCRQPRRQRG
jgi:hypothetical protein